MTCTPQSPLLPHTHYTIHMGGGMMGANGMMVDYAQAQMMGGRRSTPATCREPSDRAREAMERARVVESARSPPVSNAPR